MSSNGACEGCTCGRANGGTAAPVTNGVGPANTADYESYPREPRSFTAPANNSDARFAAQPTSTASGPAVPLRSKKWFNEMEDPGTTSIYIERYMNFGLTLAELKDERTPVIGIAQTGSDLAPCNRHHLELAKRVRDGIIAAGGTPLEFPCHPIQETGKRPTACLDRNLSYLSLVEVLYGYPLDGVVLLTGCDKT